MPDFLLPDLGEGLTEAQVVTWHVHVGDTVEIDQPLVDVETAKATVEVPSPYAGVIGSLHAAVGEVVRVGAALITVVETGLQTQSGVTSGDHEGSGNVLIGYGTPAPTARSSRRHRRLRPTSTGPNVATDQPAQQESSPTARAAVAVSSPLVRRLARDAHLDVRTVAGIGPDGLVRRHDVLRAIETAERITRIPLTGIRRATADKLSRSRREIPEATVWVDVDATELLEARLSMNSIADQGRKADGISLIALVARFAVLGLRRFPELNARVEHDEIAQYADIHLGIATQADRGLLVPVIRAAQNLTTSELNDRINDRTRAARAGTLTPAEFGRGTFTLNNYGVFGVDGSAAIINHPEVAILGIGRVIPRPWVVAGGLEVRQVGQLTLAFDHRVCDGATAGGFLRYVADCVESPTRALRDL